MSETTFKAMVVREGPEKSFQREIEERSVSDLPEGEVLIRVTHSSLNYKDALSAIGNRGVTRSYPHTPGIDAAGEVAESDSGDFSPGDRVLVTGYDLGMNTAGGFGQYIRVPAGWVVPIPDDLSAEESMAYGTAGITAALSVFHLESRGIAPEGGQILVTGATGGVGSLAVSFLAKGGYEVVGVSGKPEAESFLRDLGAASVIGREEATDDSGRPLLKARWAGVVDTVGGEMLATAIKTTKLHGSVTCCGNVASADLPMTVYPFILRGISLLGIDSQNCPMDVRRHLWGKMANEWRVDHLDRMTERVGLSELSGHIDEILAGKKKGRTVVDLS
jgi:putative YhdH/YhfP family quinone oxidoreductase